MGSSSICRVCEETCPTTGASFAVKTIALPQSPEQRAAVLKRVAREALAAQRLLQHPYAHIARHHACVERGEEVKVVMQLCPGVNLYTQLRRAGRLGEAAALRVLHQLARALGHLHGLGLVYVDLKPENVVWQDPPGRAMLVDLDLCHTMEEVEALQVLQALAPAGRLPRFWGTEEYVCPEVLQAGAAAYSPASDWWALGVLGYELLHGRTPFAGPNRERTFYNITNRGPEFESVAAPPLQGQRPQPQDSGQAAVSYDTQQLLRGLLRHKAAFRLGSKGGVGEVLQHPAFRALPPQA